MTVFLLIAGANAATLLLSKATESLLLALLAGLSRLMLAHWGSKILVALAPADVPRLAETGIDRWVLGFTLAVSTITSLLFGLVPALYVSKVELSEALKQGATRIATGGRMIGIRGVLVVAEVALAVTLVSASGLLAKSL